MARRKLLTATLVALLGLVGAMLETSLVHTDDGCAFETHCNACLLGLRTPGVVTVTFSLPRVVVVIDRVASALPASREDAAPRSIPSRGPPPA